ncbi:MAG TPA: outer membrane beta-barrel protein, partial [Longimicrobium sp.]|nr:outer membrane beta-barrel protein [Longimicrobium sp.]
MRNRVLSLALAAALVPVFAVNAAAQEIVGELPPVSKTRGFSLGAFLNASGVQVEDSDAENGIGAGVQVGYGFGQHVTVFFRVTGTSVDSPGNAEDDNYTLGHADLGARYSFGTFSSKLRPFLGGAFSGRALSFNLIEGGTLETRGPAFTGSGGLEYFLSRNFALEAALSIAYGEFNEGRYENSGWVDLEGDALS